MSTSLIIAAYAALCLIWSSTWVMIKVGLEGAPPMTAAGLRFIIASVIIFAILQKRRIALPRTAIFVKISVFIGLFQMAAAYALVYWAEQFISSGLTAILFATLPFVVAVLARFFLGDPLTPAKLGGIAIGIFGVGIIFQESLMAGGNSVKGIIAVLASVVCAGMSDIVIKKYSSQYNPVASIFLPMVIGAILLTGAGLLVEHDRSIAWTPLTITSIIYLAVFGSVIGFGLFFWLIKHIDVTVIAYQTFIIPILAALIGWIFLKETITLRIIVGGGFVVAGIALAVIPQSRKRPPHVES
jgi:drug/metabolite transporter (DMT)-like permease